MSEAWSTVSLVALAVVGYFLPVTKHEKVKIVEEPAVYRSGLGGYYQPARSPERDKLVARVKPSAVSGPPHLRILAGKCFSLINNGYKYEFCPYSNVTQKEQTMRWNAFSGILGVWKEWLIVNNTFEAMLLANGDMCPGEKPRQTKVFLKCGDANKVLSVGEPLICHYEMTFETPLGCPSDAFLVFPALTQEGQKEWEGIEEALYRDELTLQGYHKYRRRLFQKERLIPPDRTDKEVKEEEKQVTNTVENLLSNRKGEDTARGISTFQSIEQCSEAYGKLLAEASSLRKQLQMSNLTTQASQDQPTSRNHTATAEKHHPTVNTTTHLTEKGDRGRNLHRR